MTIGATGGGQWMFYISQARKRLARAAESLRQSGKIWRQSTENRNRVMDNAMADWAEAMRGTRTIEYTPTGSRTDVDLGWRRNSLKTQREYGAGTFQEIPLRDQ